MKRKLDALLNFTKWLSGCLDLLFPFLITLFPSPITQTWRDSWLKSLFGFCFHHSILWFFSDELWKLKTHFRCFQVIETELWWHFCKYTHIEGPTVRGPAVTFLLLIFFFHWVQWVWVVFFFFFFSFSFHIGLV